MPDVRKKVSFPRIANYNCALRYLVENGTNAQFIMPPKMTRRTMELGARYSPESVCTPFKSTLGSMIDALEAGADTLVMTMGVCKLGYYGELQEQIIRDLGYQFEMVNLSEYSTGNPRDYLKAVKRIDPGYKLGKLTKAAADTVLMAQHLDEIEEEYYQNCGFELEHGAYRKAYDQFLLSMELAQSTRDIERGYREARQAFSRIPLDKPEEPLRVGIVGEYFTIMDEFSNLDLEQKLADMRVEVHRWMNVTHRNLHYEGQKNLGVQISEYSQYEMGPTSTANIWCAKNYAQQGFDGIIHLKSAGCTPEIDIMPVLQNISADYRIPILYLTYDSQTSDTGLETRVEAFYDMIHMRKKVI